MDCVLFVNDSARSLEHSYRLHVGQRHWNFINFCYAPNVVGSLPRYSPSRLCVWVGDMKVEIYYYFFLLPWMSYLNLIAKTGRR